MVRANPGRRGRKPKGTPEEIRAKKIQRDREYRQNLAATRKALQEKCKELEKENEGLKRKDEKRQRKIKSLKKELSQLTARSDELKREVSDEFKKVNMVKMASRALESGVQQLQEDVLNQDDQEHRVENPEFNIPMDDNLYQILGEFVPYPDSQWSQTKGVSSGEGTSNEKAKLLPDTVNVSGYMVSLKNSLVIQDIFCLYPNIDSGFRFHLLESRNGIINTLAEVYKMAKRKEHRLEEIKHMEKGIEDLELAGLEISWLKALMVECAGKS
ncbi:hypothetical protein DITRI_Ditri11bG0034200 [Diplodiscus trichospermus]